MNSKISSDTNPNILLQNIKSQYPELSEIIDSEVTDFIPHLVINQTRTQADIDIGFFNRNSFVKNTLALT